MLDSSVFDVVVGSLGNMRLRCDRVRSLSSNPSSSQSEQ
jgi:hypothetical protein